MKFQFAGHRKKFKDKLSSASDIISKSGINADCKGDSFNAVITKKRGKPQYAFCANISGDNEIVIDGEIRLVGEKWKWYDYLFSVLSLILILPFFIFTVIPRGDDLHTLPWTPLSASTKKSREKRVRSFMIGTLNCTELND